MDNNPEDTGEILETPSASPAETITTEPSSDNIAASPEEVAWNGLKGSSQDRFITVLKERDEARNQAARFETLIKSQPSHPTPVSNPSADDPAIRDAVQKLSGVGIATKAEMKDEINQTVGNLIHNFELEKLETKYNGTNGLPKFDRTEYNDFVTRNPQFQYYAPEDVYEKMYSEDILEARIKTKTTDNSGQSNTSSLRPIKTTVREEQWTPETIQKRLQESDAKLWYAKNIDLVNKVLASQAPKAE